MSGAIAEAALENSIGSGEENVSGLPGVYVDIREKDALLVFRALCRLSMKPLPDGSFRYSHFLLLFVIY